MNAKCATTPRDWGGGGGAGGQARRSGVRRNPVLTGIDHGSMKGQRSTCYIKGQRSTGVAVTARVSLDGFALCIVRFSLCRPVTAHTHHVHAIGAQYGLRLRVWGLGRLPATAWRCEPIRVPASAHRANGRIPPPGGPTADRTYTAGHPPRPAGNKLLKGQAETFKRTPRGSAGLGAGGHRSIHDTGAH